MFVYFWWYYLVPIEGMDGSVMKRRNLVRGALKLRFSGTYPLAVTSI